MRELIRGFWRRVKGVFFRSQSEMESKKEELAPLADIRGEQSPVYSGDEIEASEPVQEKGGVPSNEGIPVPPLESPSGLLKEHDKWEVRPCKVREFDKVGRLFMEGGDLVIKIDGLPFYVILARDLKRHMDGETVDIRDTEGHNAVGTAGPSVSGKAVNFRVGERLYTVPNRNFKAMVEGSARKAPLFVGREVRIQ